MPDESTTQMALVHSTRFLDRLQYLMMQQARTVLAESNGTASHAARVLYAQQFIGAPSTLTAAAAIMLTGGTNLIGTVIDVAGTPDSNATDGAILSQVATYWNALAKVAT